MCACSLHRIPLSWQYVNIDLYVFHGLNDDSISVDSFKIYAEGVATTELALSLTDKRRVSITN